MRPASRYPVDRYLVESSKRMDIIEIMDEDLWKPEPALRPEDEYLLRKLHDMLQSTADDLKVLSGELSKYHESGVQVKTLPTPLDEDFNEKVHVEEVVNAKFHGNKIINASQSTSQKSPTPVQDLIANELRKKEVRCESGNEIKKTKNLKISGTKLVHIPESANYVLDTKPLELRSKNIPSKERAVQYNEIVYQEIKKDEENSSQKQFQIHEMPSINIRSEFKIQQVAQLDITPDSNTDKEVSTGKNNVCVISVNHDLPTVSSSKELQRIEVNFETAPVRKISKMLSYESSESSPNMVGKRKNIKQKLVPDTKKPNTRRPETKYLKFDSKKAQTNLNDWKRKLSSVYGQSSKESKPQLKLKKTTPKLSNTQNHDKQLSELKTTLNNPTEYIPYAKLTLGGVHVKDIEEEISHVSNRKDLPLSPILDKILSRQNSFSNEISQKKENKSNLKVLTTSDENLLQEVLDIEEKVSITLSKNLNQCIDSNQTSSNNRESTNSTDNTYADDFEADNSNGITEKSESSNKMPHLNDSIRIDGDHDQPKREHIHNRTSVKVSNLSLKHKIETFEFIHSIDTQENATQSNVVNKMSLKETQTSPRSDTPFHNDQSIDPKHEVENMFKLEKDFIKKLIVDEYSDLIININKPSTSNDSRTYIDSKNISSVQKNTQTSPARVKSVMTSPTRTKTRTTSPLALSVTVDKQISPLIALSTEKNLPATVGSDNSVHLDEFDITINLSSPRFQLQLPKSASIAKSNQTDSKKLRSKFPSSSSSSVEDYTSSDISFGEMRRFQRRSRRHKVTSVSEFSSSTSKCSEHSFVVPIRSEGEVSVCQTKSNKYSKSEGEISLGQLR
ncbi:unnamed protein product [Pieris macdunnoughi]|uniref:Uncharacterized protein n=1 Tax=Pieris macdunnoughi TaxID=345717 RepID=A0A821QV80_9NEOP|nr:unnamed protein product [Pieris macdunnoughi]